jgi:hypothetical protein
MKNGSLYGSKHFRNINLLQKPSIPYKTSSFNEARVSASSTVQERDPEIRHG